MEGSSASSKIKTVVFFCSLFIQLNTNVELLSFIRNAVMERRFTSTAGGLRLVSIFVSILET